MISGSNGTRHIIDDPAENKEITFQEGDTLDISAILPEEGVNQFNLKQFIKIHPSGIFFDSAGAGQFSESHQVGRFSAQSLAFNAMIAVQISDTSIISFDRTSNDDAIVRDSSAVGAEGEGYNVVDGAASNDTLRGSTDRDALRGFWGDDVLEGGSGNDLYIGGAGSDRYVLNDTDSVEKLDFKSTRFERDVIDVSSLMPAEATAGNLSNYLKITEEGVFLDETGSGEFYDDNQIAEFTEDSVFGSDELLIKINDNDPVSFSTDSTVGVQMSEGESYMAENSLSDIMTKYTSNRLHDRSDKDDSSGAEAIVINSNAGDKINFKLDGHDVDEAYGGAGSEILDASGISQADRKILLFGGGGDDTLIGNDEGNLLDGGEGNDRFETGTGKDILAGGEGQDEFILQFQASDALNTRSDMVYDFTSMEGHRDLVDLTNVVPAEATAENIHAYVKITNTGIYIDSSGEGMFDEFNQLARFGARSDLDNLIRLRLPDDSVIEFDRTEADQTLTGDDGDDTLHAGDGADVLRGGAGDDILDGDALASEKSADELYGGEGNDELHVDRLDLTDGTIEGGTGYDSVILDGEADEDLTVDLNALGVERAVGSYSNDTLDGSGYVQNSGYNKETGAFEDYIAQRLNLFGRAGEDSLTGGAGRDYLDGGTGDDILTDGAGRDVLIGGTGNDTFALSNDSSLDRIYDFKSTDTEMDILDISDLVPENMEMEDIGLYFYVDGDNIYYDTNGNSEFTSDHAVARFGPSTDLTRDMEVVVNGHSIRKVLNSRIVYDQDEAFIDEDEAFTFEAEYLLGGMTSDNAYSMSNIELASGQGDIVDNGDGTWTLTPSEHWNGDISLNLTANNGSQNITDTYSVNVRAVADEVQVALAENVSTDFSEPGLNEGEAWRAVDPGIWGWSTDNSSGHVELGRGSTYGGSAENEGIIELEYLSGEASNMYRVLDTQPGAMYRFSMDITGRNGVAASNATVEVLWEGNVIDTISYSGFEWHTHTYDLVATQENPRIEFRATTQDGQGALIDNIALDFAGFEGSEDSSIPINLGTQLVDTDGSETVSSSISGLPVGTVITDGVNSARVTDADTPMQMEGWDNENLQITPPANFSGEIEIILGAIATENSNNDTQTTEIPIKLNVLAVNDTPETEDNQLVIATEGSYTFRAADFNFTDVDTADSFQSVTISTLPASGSLTFNNQVVTSGQEIDAADISNLVYTAPAGDADVSSSFDFTVSDGETSSEQSTFSIIARPLDTTDPDNPTLTGTDDSETLSGSDQSDTLEGGAGDDKLQGGAGNDTLIGGDGSDQYIWLTSDTGTEETPAEDVVSDFQTGEGGDILNLSDILQDNNSIEDALELNFENGSTTIEVTPDPDGGVTQKITLEGVDLSGYGGASSDIEIINNLINDGNLQIE